MTRPTRTKEQQQQQQQQHKSGKKQQQQQKKKRHKARARHKSVPEAAGPVSVAPVYLRPKPNRKKHSMLKRLHTAVAGAVDWPSLLWPFKQVLKLFLLVLKFAGGVVFSVLSYVVAFIAATHKNAVETLKYDHHLVYCFGFCYVFPYVTDYITYWAPPWAAPCLWFVFLMQVLCMQGPPQLVMVLRVTLPLLFLTRGVSQNSILVGLNGSERLVVAFLLSSFKTQEYYRPGFILALSLSIIISLFMGNYKVVQWITLIGCLVEIHEGKPVKSRLPGMIGSDSGGSSGGAIPKKLHLNPHFVPLNSTSTSALNRERQAEDEYVSIWESLMSFLGGPAVTGNTASYPLVKPKKHKTQHRVKRRN
jgi:hypothetical protein